MVINKKVIKIQKFSILQDTFLLKFVGAAFVGTVFVTSLISSRVITKSPIILPKYLSHLVQF